MSQHDISLAILCVYAAVLLLICLLASTITTRKVGGIRFLRIHRWQFSFCRVRTLRPVI